MKNNSFSEDCQALFIRCIYTLVKKQENSRLVILNKLLKLVV